VAISTMSFSHWFRSCGRLGAMTNLHRLAYLPMAHLGYARKRTMTYDLNSNEFSIVFIRHRCRETFIQTHIGHAPVPVMYKYFL
jgi:hypothetical protein